MSWPAAARRRVSPSTNRIASVGQAGTLEVTAEAPNAEFTTLTIALEQNGKSVPLFALDAAPAPPARPPRTRASPRSTLQIDLAAARQAERPRAAVRRRAHRRHRDAAVVPEPAHADEHGGEGLPGAPRAAAHRRRCRRITTSTTAAPRWSSTARRRPTSRRACASATSSIPGFPLPARAPTRRSRSRSSRCSTIRISTRRSPAFARDEAGNEAKATLRRQRLREAVQEEPHRARRQVHQPRRAGDPRALAGAEDDAAAEGGDMLAGVPARSTASCGGSTPTRSPRSRRRPRRRGCGKARSSSSATRRSRRASPTTAPTSTRARKSISRSTSASTSRSPRTCRSSRPTPAPCCNAELARHLRQLRDHRPRHGRAVAVRPPVVVRRQGRRHGRRAARRSAAATRPGSPAAITCISRCSSAGGW